MAGVIFAYIGAFTRWLFGGMRGSVKQRFIGDENDDPSLKFSSSVLNRIIGIIVFVVIIAVIGYFDRILLD